MKDLIKIEIEKADAAHPVTSTELIEIIRRETGERITARRIRSIVDELRNDGAEIAGFMTGRKGYFMLRTEDDAREYRRQITANAAKQFATNNLVIGNFNRKYNADMPLFADVI